MLPHLGGKIASIVVDGQELLQSPLAPPAPRTRTISFDAGDASGWDECLPSVAECDVATDAGSAHVPDHGDLWRVAWEKQGSENRDPGSDGQSVTLRGECFSLPARVGALVDGLRKSRAAGGSIWITADQYRRSTRFRGPGPPTRFSLSRPATASFCRSRFVRYGSRDQADNAWARAATTVAWPIAQLAGGGQTDLSVAQSCGYRHRRQALYRSPERKRKLVRAREALRSSSYQGEL